MTRPRTDLDMVSMAKASDIHLLFTQHSSFLAFTFSLLLINLHTEFGEPGLEFTIFKEIWYTAVEFCAFLYPLHYAWIAQYNYGDALYTSIVQHVKGWDVTVRTCAQRSTVVRI